MPTISRKHLEELPIHSLCLFFAMDRSDRTLILCKTIGDKVNKVPCQFIPTLSLFTSQVAFQPTSTTPKASCSNTSATLDAKALAFRRRLDERSMNWSGRSSVGASWCRMGPPLGGLLVTRSTRFADPFFVVRSLLINRKKIHKDCNHRC